MSLGCPWKDFLVNLNEHSKVCFFDKNRMSEHMKAFVDNESKDIIDNDGGDPDQSVNSNNFLGFNANVGLKARLYNKNKELMDKILAQPTAISQEIKSIDKRDSFFEMLNKYE
jgi:hypothetical protein